VYDTDETAEEETLPKNAQKLRVRIERNHRGGKSVTIVAGFTGAETDLKELGKLLKTKCGVGGTVKEGEIIVQGEFKEKIIELLKREGYTQTK
jgi:translation initiation factor 1